MIMERRKTVHATKLGRKALLKIIDQEIESNRHMAQLIQRMDMGQRYIALLVRYHIEKLQGATGIVMPWQKAQVALLETVRDVLNGSKPIPEINHPCSMCEAEVAILDLPQYKDNPPTVVCPDCNQLIAQAKQLVTEAGVEKREAILQLHQIKSVPDLAKASRDTLHAIIITLTQG